MKELNRALIIGLGIGWMCGILVSVFILPAPSQDVASDIMDYPQIQTLEARAYLKDGNLVQVRVMISTKEDLATPVMKITGSEFINRLSSKYSTSEVDELMQRFKKDSVKYLGLPCSATFAKVAVEEI